MLTTVRQNVLGIASSVVVCSYGNFRPKPWSFARSTVIGGLAGFGGATLGLFMNLRAHKKFIDSLEDQRGFKRALTNVSARLDGISPIPQQQDTYGQGDTSHQYVSSSINSGNFHMLRSRRTMFLTLINLLWQCWGMYLDLLTLCRMVDGMQFVRRTRVIQVELLPGMLYARVTNATTLQHQMKRR